MNSNDNDQKNTPTTLKPELAFEWVKYKKETHSESLVSKLSAKTTQKIDKRPEEKVVEEVEPDVFTKETFKNDPVKERMYLWYAAIPGKIEISLEEFSKIIQMPDLMETEEFLFRNPPLKYGYLWRGKVLKFDDDTKERLKQFLESE